MTPPPLCIIQARLKSSRLEHKMLQTLGGETLIARSHKMAASIFTKLETVVAVPKSDEAGPLGDELRRIGAEIFAWDGPEWDVLGRFHACAHHYRWHPDSILYRWTPDDWNRRAYAIHQVLHGQRVPVELGGEAFTLGMLDAAWSDTHKVYGTPDYERLREHITYALFPTQPPKAAEGVWTIDTAEDLERARAMVEDDAEAFR